MRRFRSNKRELAAGNMDKFNWSTLPCCCVVMESRVSDVVEKTSTRRRSQIPCVVVEKITTRRSEGVGVVVEKKKKVDELSTKIRVIYLQQ